VVPVANPRVCLSGGQHANVGAVPVVGALQSAVAGAAVIFTRSAGASALADEVNVSCVIPRDAGIGTHAVAETVDRARISGETPKL